MKHLIIILAIVSFSSCYAPKYVGYYGCTKKNCMTITYDYCRYHLCNKGAIEALVQDMNNHSERGIWINRDSLVPIPFPIRGDQFIQAAPVNFDSVTRAILNMR